MSSYSVFVEHQGAPAVEYRLSGAITVGRGRDSGVRVASAFLLPKHFVLRTDATGVHLEPLTAHSHRNPTLGTYVNGEQVLGRRLLAVGDRLSPLSKPTRDHPVFVIGRSVRPIEPGAARASSSATPWWKFWA